MSKETDRKTFERLCNAGPRHSAIAREGYLDANDTARWEGFKVALAYAAKQHEAEIQRAIKFTVSRTLSDVIFGRAHDEKIEETVARYVTAFRAQQQEKQS